MNHDVPAEDASILYYDGDYPSLELDGARPEDAATLARIGILGDVDHYKDLAERTGGPVLEMGCGTGRLAIPLARMGLEVWGVDVSEAMLARLAERLAAEPEAVRARVRAERADATALDLPRKDFPLAIIPFNVLMLIADLGGQRRALASAARHVAPGGVLALDVMNPLIIPLDEQRQPQPSEPRRNPRTGNSYVRNSLHSRIDERQVQQLYGWYDELDAKGRIATTDYKFHWRIIFRWELELMLNEAGFSVESVAGGFDGAPWTVDSKRIVVTARKG